jgi:dUTP pyrophosphatase
MYVQLDAGAALPTRVYKGDAGFDLYTLNDWTIQPGEFVDVPVGCAVQFPDRVWGMIVGRSSTLRKHDLMVMPGVIDTGYRGPLFAGVRSMRDTAYNVKRGERLAQLIPFANVAMDLHPTAVDVLSPSDRGEAGFGSSGA